MAFLHALLQRECGACWAFSAASAIEWHWAIKKNSTVTVSRQQMVDCVQSNFGCNGGLIENALAYAQSSGLMSDAEYPYRSRVTQCNYDPAKVILRTNGFEKLSNLKEPALTCILKEKGPIAIGLDASARGLQHYDTGLFNDLDCNGEYLNHAVVLVGYGVDQNGRKYWIAQNSWSNKWGEDGFFRILFGENHCGVAVTPLIPVL
ncbi:unnamed protein product [Dibothriocephalus latus]|uniref:Peptidase C1A papain C-terminal domain-containing protein n=1 Tax=Dibothriocephalus latus TaxID=60516 RepID=A0A3P7KWT3_DIBLA|nr:unnamed protein product [Dibothriocephalus latus]